MKGMNATVALDWHTFPALGYLQSHSWQCNTQTQVNIYLSLKGNQLFMLIVYHCGGITLKTTRMKCPLHLSVTSTQLFVLWHFFTTSTHCTCFFLCVLFKRKTKKKH